MDRRLQPRFDGLVGVPDHRLEGRDHVADHVFGCIVQQDGEPVAGIDAQVLASDQLGEQRVLGDGENMRPRGLPVPARDAGEPVGDVLDLDVERGGVEQV